MPGQVTRPTFYEGQVLAAADLEANVAYARTDSALHDRIEHTWGVAEGLDFRTVEQTTAAGDKYLEVYLRPGVAVDRNGRRVVVGKEQLLRYTEFRDQGVFSRSDLNRPKDELLYPVFLRGVDRDEVGSRGGGGGACRARGGTSRVIEAFELEFGRPGTELAELEKPPPAVDAGPGAGERVLVGFVRWDDQIAGGRFVGVDYETPTSKVRYVGVRASEVVAHKGTLALSSRPAGTRYTVALGEMRAGGAELRFGKQEGDGALSKVFSVNDRGDLWVAGTIGSEVPQVPVVESGSIFHGLRVPLPAGITEDQVSGGSVALQIAVTPRFPGVKQIPSSTTAVTRCHAVPIECRVAPDRTVSCVVRWEEEASPITFRIDLPASCDYVVIAVPAKKATP